MTKARATAVRLAPAGRAVLVLGIAAPELAGRRFTIDGRRISATRVGRVALLVTYVERDAYTAEALEELRGDDERLASEARSYQRAIERAAVHAPVAPAGLLTVVTEAAELDALPPDRVLRWSRQLTRLGERRECALLCYAGPHALPAFEPYAVAVAMRALRMQKPDFGTEPAIAAHLEATWKAVAEFGVSTRKLRAVTKRERFGATLLIDPTEIDRLRTTLAAHAADAAALGLTWYLEGPRLPFSFA